MSCIEAMVWSDWVMSNSSHCITRIGRHHRHTHTQTSNKARLYPRRGLKTVVSTSQQFRNVVNVHACRSYAHTSIAIGNSEFLKQQPIPPCVYELTCRITLLLEIVAVWQQRKINKRKYNAMHYTMLGDCFLCPMGWGEILSKCLLKNAREIDPNGNDLWQTKG